MNVAPSQAFEAVNRWSASGLTGTMGVRILDNAGHTTTARVTAGIAEYPASSGIYYASLTAPGTKGQYTVLWDDGVVTPGHIYTEELVVTTNYPAVATTGSSYLTREQLKSTLSISVSTFDNDIDLAIVAASRAVDLIANRRFYPTAETRYYTGICYSRDLYIDDVVTIDALTVDNDGDGVYETTWTDGTDYILLPSNQALVDWPSQQVHLKLLQGRIFPEWEQAIKIEGTFGFAEVPAGISQYAAILAARLMRRAKDAPFGFLTHGAADAAAFIARQDPDFELLVGPYIRPKRILA